MAVRLPIEKAVEAGGLQDFEMLFGPSPESLQRVPLSQANVVGQYRTKYDTADQVVLEHSIVSAGLRNPILLSVMTPAEAEEYLDFTNRSWEADTSLDDLVPNSDGNYFIVLAGHRRTLAMKRAVDGLEKDQSKVGVSAFLTPTDTMLDIMKIQGSENVYKPPKPQDKARLINQMFLYGMQYQIYGSIAEFIDDSPFSEHECRDALHYVLLPAGVHDYVESDVLGYTAAVKFYPLLEASYTYHRSRGVPGSKIELAMLGYFISDVRHMMARHNTLNSATVANFVKQRAADLSSEQTDLFMVNQGPVLEAQRSLPVMSLLLRQTEAVQNIIHVMNSHGGIEGWRADVPVDVRTKLVATLGLAIQNVRSLRQRADPDAIDSMPEVDDLLAEADGLLVVV